MKRFLDAVDMTSVGAPLDMDDWSVNCERTRARTERSSTTSTLYRFACPIISFADQLRRLFALYVCCAALWRSVSSLLRLSAKLVQRMHDSRGQQRTRCRRLLQMKKIKVELSTGLQVMPLAVTHGGRKAQMEPFVASCQEPMPRYSKLQRIRCRSPGNEASPLQYSGALDIFYAPQSGRPSRGRLRCARIKPIRSPELHQPQTPLN
ncbi:hypothetical protein DFH11DRAFT_460171 [Phellopilus nigrolimitatus]|nr:hypothetical protein DFH11DRAFT_460171 [Phellopilus nigrolimitatus]